MTQFGLAASERQVFEAQILLDNGDDHQAASTAYAAMLQAAKALIQVQYIDVKDDPESIVQEFRKRFYDTQLFYDPFAGPKFALYLFHAHDEGVTDLHPAAVRRRIEEASLFIEAAYACYNRLGQQQTLI
jgi:sulfite reductase (ferredoxin)